MQILVSAMEPFVGMRGSDLGLELFRQKIPVLLALSAKAHGTRTEASPKAVWGNAGIKFLHPRDF